MHSLVLRSLFVLILCISMSPVAAKAGSLGTGDTQASTAPGTADSGSGRSTEAPSPTSNVNEGISGQFITIQPQTPDLKYTDVVPSTGTSPSADSSQEPEDARGKTREKLQVVYDQETEHDRSIKIALIIAFGISLALNVFLATSLIARKRGL